MGRSKSLIKTVTPTSSLHKLRVGSGLGARAGIAGLVYGVLREAFGEGGSSSSGVEDHRLAARAERVTRLAWHSLLMATVAHGAGAPSAWQRLAPSTVRAIHDWTAGRSVHLSMEASRLVANVVTSALVARGTAIVLTPALSVPMAFVTGAAASGAASWLTDRFVAYRFRNNLKAKL